MLKRWLSKSLAIAVFTSLIACLQSSPAHALVSGCTVGSSQSCPGDSAWQIKQATGTNTNGNYWVMLNGSAVKIYAIMDSTMGGGGWMLAMKGTTTGNDFPYSANYWTTANTLIPSGETNPTNLSGNNADAKYDVYNYANANQVMAIYPGYTSTGNGGAYTGNSYGFTWAETTTNTVAFGGSNAPLSYVSPYSNAVSSPVNLQSYNGGNGANCPTTAGTLLSLMGGTPVRCLIRQPKISWDSAEAPYSVIGNGIFSSQNAIQFFGFNFTNSYRSQYNVRWGLNWNEGVTYNDDSPDVGGGIGGAWGTQAGDYNSCCSTASGKNTQMAFEMYVRNTGASITATTAALSSGTPAPTGGTVGLSASNTSWTATAVDNTTPGNTLAVSGSGPLTISGASPNDSITVTLSYTSNSGYSGYGTLTYSFYASNGTTTSSAALNSGLVSSSYRTGSPITATFTGAPGKATFYFSTISGIKKPIPGCRNVLTTGSGPYSANCAWKPALHGQVLITVVYAPTGIGYLSSTSSFLLTIAARSGNR